MSCPYIWNKWILPAVSHNFAGIYCLMSEKKNITLTVLEYNFLLNIVHLCVIVKIYIMRPMTIKVNVAMVYYCAVQFCTIFALSIKASVCFIGWKVIPVTEAFNFVCLHTRWMIAVVHNIERIAAIKRKISIIMLLKNDLLLSSFLDFANSCSFCLCFLTRSFRVFGACNNLVSNVV